MLISTKQKKSLKIEGRDAERFVMFAKKQFDNLKKRRISVPVTLYQL